jgi:hypothetical protein
MACILKSHVRGKPVLSYVLSLPKSLSKDSHAWFGSGGGVSDGSAHHNLGRATELLILSQWLEEGFLFNYGYVDFSFQEVFKADLLFYQHHDFFKLTQSSSKSSGG